MVEQTGAKLAISARQKEVAAEIAELTKKGVPLDHAKMWVMTLRSARRRAEHAEKKGDRA